MAGERRWLIRNCEKLVFQLCSQPDSGSRTHTLSLWWSEKRIECKARWNCNSVRLSTENGSRTADKQASPAGPAPMMQTSKKDDSSLFAHMIRHDNIMASWSRKKRLEMVFVEKMKWPKGPTWARVHFNALFGHLKATWIGLQWLVERLFKARPYDDNGFWPVQA